MKSLFDYIDGNSFPQKKPTTKLLINKINFITFYYILS